MLSSLSILVQEEYKAIYKQEYYSFILSDIDYSFFRNFYDINKLLKKLNKIVLKHYVIYNQAIFIKNEIIKEEVNNLEHCIIKKILYYYGYSKIFLEFLKSEKVLFSDTYNLNVKEFDTKLLTFLLSKLIKIKTTFV